MPDWPEFREFDLEEFSESERTEFVRKYLSNHRVAAEGQLDLSVIEARIERVNELASLAPEVFAKPVHAKILTDLASDPVFDLNHFGDHVTRWQLYEAFFESLAERETEKSARRDIGDEARLHFLREIAMWLWTEKAGSTSFNVGELPLPLVEDLSEGDTLDSETKVREYLVGSFLEKKAGDIFYFGHRSFAEFLVAQRMATVRPLASDHEKYSDLIRDDVEAFLSEGIDQGTAASWVPTLSYANGRIRLPYIEFLCKRVGGLRHLRALLAPDSLWRNILDHFDDKLEFGPVLERRLIQSLKKADTAYASIIIGLLDASFASRELDLTSVDHFLLEELAAAFVDREFLRIKDEFGLLANRPEFGDPRLLSRGMLSRDYSGRNICIDWAGVYSHSRDVLKAIGVDLVIDGHDDAQGLKVILEASINGTRKKVRLLNRREGRKKMDLLLRRQITSRPSVTGA